MNSYWKTWLVFCLLGIGLNVWAEDQEEIEATLQGFANGFQSLDKALALRYVARDSDMGGRYRYQGTFYQEVSGDIDTTRDELRTYANRGVPDLGFSFKLDVQEVIITGDQAQARTRQFVSQRSTGGGQVSEMIYTLRRETNGWLITGYIEPAADRRMRHQRACREFGSRLEAALLAGEIERFVDILHFCIVGEPREGSLPAAEAFLREQGLAEFIDYFKNPRRPRRPRVYVSDYDTGTVRFSGVSVPDGSSDRKLEVRIAPKLLREEEARLQAEGYPGNRPSTGERPRVRSQDVTRRDLVLTLDGLPAVYQDPNRFVAAVYRYGTEERTLQIEPQEFAAEHVLAGVPLGGDLTIFSVQNQDGLPWVYVEDVQKTALRLPEEATRHFRPDRFIPITLSCQDETELEKFHSLDLYLNRDALTPVFVYRVGPVDGPWSKEVSVEPGMYYLFRGKGGNKDAFISPLAVLQEEGARYEITLPQTESRRPAIEFESRTIDFGEIQPDSRHTATFRFANTGNTTLTILRVDKCCGAIVDLDRKSIVPDDMATLKVTYQGGALDDSSDRTVTLYTNDPENRSVELTTTWRLVSTVEPRPQEMN